VDVDFGVPFTSCSAHQNHDYQQLVYGTWVLHWNNGKVLENPSLPLQWLLLQEEEDSSACSQARQEPRVRQGRHLHLSAIAQSRPVLFRPWTAVSLPRLRKPVEMLPPTGQLLLDLDLTAVEAEVEKET
ncbi:unnamed protein product, partial [Amoebophrya sp. A25]